MIKKYNNVPVGELWSFRVDSVVLLWMFGHKGE